MLKIGSLAFSAVFLLGLTRCAQSITSKNSSSTVNCKATNPASVIQNYLLQYDAEEDKTYFEASFRAGQALGSSLRVEAPCAISTASATLKERLVGYTRYVARTSGVTTSAIFRFTDAYEVAWNNTVTLSTIALSSPPASISAAASCLTAGKSGCYTFNFTPAIDPTTDLVILEFVDSKLTPMAYKSFSPYRAEGETTTSKFSITNDPTPEYRESIEYTFPVGQPLFVRAVREVRTKIEGAGDAGKSGVLISRYYSAYSTVTVTN